MIRVSICIATYNGEKYIKEQIDSIISQLSEEDEIIISDDHSTDNTLKVIKEYKDPRIKIFLNKNEAGYTENFQNALRESQGKYIFLSDQDDKWLNNKLDITLRYLMNENYHMVISDCIVVDEGLNTISESLFETRGSKGGLVNTLIKANYLGCCMAFDRKVLKKSIPFPKYHKYLPHDLWLGLIGYAFFKVKTTDEKLILYRRHSTNASNGGLKSSSTIKFKIEYRIYALIKVISVYFQDKLLRTRE